jgi:hypothetical protein
MSGLSHQSKPPAVLRFSLFASSGQTPFLKGNAMKKQIVVIGTALVCLGICVSENAGCGGSGSYSYHTPHYSQSY